MVHRHSFQRLLLVLPLFTAACATSGWQGARERVEDLTARVENVRLEAEVARARTADTLVQLRTLTTPDSGQDIVAVYGRMVESIDAAEQQASRFLGAVTPMKESANEVFAQWERDVAAIASDDLRERGQTRLQRAKERFAAIVAAVDTAEVTLTGFHRALRDHTLFLGHDLNRESLREIRAELLTVAATEKEVDAHLESTMKAARAYVGAAAVPTGSAAMPPAAPAKDK